jgi:hypothetical protein
MEILLNTTIEAEAGLLFSLFPIALLGFFKRKNEKKMTREDLKEAEKYGGSDYEDWGEYQKPNGKPSFDKGGHRERSIVNDPKHSKHWKKEDKKHKYKHITGDES